MTVIFITEYNSECYGVIFQNNECVKVQKFEDISNDKNTILNIKPIELFVGKNQACFMNAMSGAFDRMVFDGNSILLKMSEEWNRHRYVNISGNMVCSFLTNDNIYEYISNMGKNLTIYSIAVGDENFYFFTPHFKIFRRDKIDYDDLLKTIEISVDPYDYHLSNCGKDSFKKLRLYKIHSKYDWKNHFGAIGDIDRM